MVRFEDWKGIWGYLKTGTGFISRFRENLLLSKQMWPKNLSSRASAGIRDEWWGKSVSKKVLEKLDEIEKIINGERGIRFKAGDPVQVLGEAIDKADKGFGEVVVMLRDYAPEHELIHSLDKQKDMEKEFSIGAMKVVAHYDPEYGTSYAANVYQSMAGDPRDVINPRYVADYIKSLQGAKQVLEKAGFGKLWRGEIHIYPKAKAAREGYSSANAAYVPDEDTIEVYGTYNVKMVRSLVHEIGHRHYFKGLTQAERGEFGKYFGAVKPVTHYGSTNAEEEFSETFANYVMGDNLDRDQRERFKQFALRRIKRQEARDKESVLQAVFG
jgi:hypothetical protein